MNISVEISMYPLTDNYIPEIEEFIAFLHTASGIKVEPNTMSTQLFGEFDDVMTALREGLRRACSSGGQKAFVLKIVNSDLRPA